MNKTMLYIVHKYNTMSWVAQQIVNSFVWFFVTFLGASPHHIEDVKRKKTNNIFTTILFQWLSDFRFVCHIKWIKHDICLGKSDNKWNQLPFFRKFLLIIVTTHSSFLFLFFVRFLFAKEQKRWSEKTIWKQSVEQYLIFNCVQ